MEDADDWAERVRKEKASKILQVSREGGVRKEKASTLLQLSREGGCAKRRPARYCRLVGSQGGQGGREGGGYVLSVLYSLY